MSQLIRWSPLALLSDDFEKLVEDFGKHDVAGFTPSIDVYQSKDDVVVETPLPGVDLENIELTIEHDVLSIRGKSERKSEVDEKNYYRREVRSGQFYRSVALPAAVDGDKAEAVYEKGVLKIRIPKIPEAKPKTIKVRPAGQ